MSIAKIFEGYIRQQQKLSRSDAFIGFAERQTPAVVKARHRAAEKRHEKAKEKALRERDDLFQLWRQWRRERIETLLAGPYGAEAQALLALLQTVSLDDGPRLIELVRAGNLQHTDPDTRFEILSLINTAITTLRERAGLPLFDDALREMFR